MTQKIAGKGFLALAVGAALGLSSQVHADVLIGVAGPHTGPSAAIGEQYWRGASQAAADINAAGGINGEPIKLVKGDDACEPKQAVAVANRLVDQEQVAGVIGHFCSSSTIPASVVYDEAGILTITPGSTNPQVTERGLTGMFRMCGRDDQQGQVAADFIIDTLKGKRVALIHDKDTYGQGIADATRARLKERGVSEVLYEGLTRGEKDFNALVTKLRAAEVDVVYFGGLHPEAGPLLRQMREQGLTAHFVSGDGVVTDEMVTTAGGPQYVKGAYMTFGADPRKIADGQAVIEKLRAGGYEPEGYTLYAYASLQAMAAAFNAVGSNDLAKASEWLKSNSVPTVMGPKAWDAKGDLKVSDYVLYQWDDQGKYHQLP
ncbi:leucine/isoleucine/valine transporter subunit; periplasmic-binding component of ABC superfamily [Pseudomonas sp. OF001]|uniref:branched-chain amino acid ABC transporter substrate-binding protein n=1 Tax=Pseudomonas sp. OF001 TaxID=2772300 RepID=UPI001917CD1F|nr:branched-chain amino acid ABC transporter substrate-binding protein [Pseudomonas sp. OF001]CAD5376496.1 leucine/isoleucine/valine transporter subunit; periplasmic-binding component of ABC superfamily [Pseudomonas sp. OF001]